ncbi:outer dense fiber protein 3-like protein 2 [Mustela erminea]|uniref:outer dense fiber protein 3-like protein 2 n=1 Tax=Mustela erminea TaxID=36723 RepID=UPI001386D86A|nr:outer dense fiber protein 3-like protein 2 [Mustela erminea]
MQPFLLACKHPRTRRRQEFRASAGGPRPPARPLPAARGEILPWLVLGRGRRPYRPSPAANIKGPSARGEPACRPKPEACGTAQIGPPGPHSGSRKGNLHISQKETQPKGSGEARPRLSPIRHRDPPSASLAAEKLGAFMASREEGSQAERMSPLRHLSLSPFSPHTCTTLTPLPRSQPSCRPPAPTWLPVSDTPKPPLSPKRLPSPPIWSSPPQCGNVPAAHTDKNNYQSGAEADAGPDQ